ncbi:hypothetical protein N8J89_11260 [Crossiella sp. CA-258035]|uniref:hypothetical protein n=1 Tax=Crossiella sp. CA-258035 TaxID=2981138 RepID=UPI0024BC58CD|nr:hypothetical protein [Crossiella sp. CA-258035]WHT21609.1 hypothetical protein N8J89_11260 [Crossiella sp. CA-258035]
MRTWHLPAFYRTWTAQDSRGTCVSQLAHTPDGLHLRLGCTQQYDFALTPQAARTLAKSLRTNTPCVQGGLSLTPGPAGDTTLTATLPADSWTLVLDRDQAARLARHLADAMSHHQA